MTKSNNSLRNRLIDDAVQRLSTQNYKLEVTYRLVPRDVDRSLNDDQILSIQSYIDLQDINAYPPMSNTEIIHEMTMQILEKLIVTKYPPNYEKLNESKDDN